MVKSPKLQGTSRNTKVLPNLKNLHSVRMSVNNNNHQMPKVLVIKLIKLFPYISGHPIRRRRKSTVIIVLIISRKE
jgi:hypothetical protein